MRAVQVMAPGRAEFIDMPKPTLKPGHALIRTHRLSLCGSDTRMLYYAPADHYPFPPATTGHEMVGLVEAIDAPGSGIKVGDMALVLVDGHLAMSEYYLAPVDKVFVLPPDKPVEHMLQAQQVGTVIFACKVLPNLIGKDVAVIGQGSAGLWFNYMARRMGAKRVIGVDLQAHRLAVAGRYGATDTLHNAGLGIEATTEALARVTDGQLADVVIEAAGEAESINLAYNLIKIDGDVLYFGVPRAEQIMVDFATFFWKYPRVKAVCGAQREPGQTSTKLALDLIAGGEIDVGPILTHSFPFDQVMEAYELQNTLDEGAIKIVIEMPAS